MAKFRQSGSGFTMIEAIVVIAITGILSAVVAVFIKRPVEGYFDAARRAELTDIGNTAVRRLERDLHAALPNSIRVTTDVAGVTYLEYLEVRTGGRYRSEVDSGGGGDPLNFAAVDSTFDILGPAITFNAGDQIVVFNAGVAGADAYASDNISPITGVAGNTVSIAPIRFPFASPGSRFQVVTGPVTYVCAPGSAAGNGTGTLRRYWGYAIQDVQTKTDSIAKLDALVTPATATRGSALLANNVSFCNIQPPENLPQPGYALVAIRLTLMQSNESVRLYHETHINNVP